MTDHVSPAAGQPASHRLAMLARVEVVPVLEDSEVEGYRLVETPSWWLAKYADLDSEFAPNILGTVSIEQSDRDRLTAEAPDLPELGPVRSTSARAWEDAKQVRFVIGKGFRFFPEGG